MSEVKHQCCARVGDWLRHTCGNNAKYERENKWYCGMHDPVAVKARDDKRNDEWNAKHDAETAAQAKAAAKRKETERRAACFDELVEALKHYANGSNWGEDHEGVLREWREPDSQTPDAYEGFGIARAALIKAGAQP